MVHPNPCYVHFLLCTSLIIVFQVCSLAAHAQMPANAAPGKLKKTIQAHAASSLIDTMTGRQKQQAAADARAKFTSLTNLPQLPKRDSIKADLNPFRNLLFNRPAFRLNGGVVSYNFNYRSIIDTPYAEKDIVQHNVTGRLNFTIAGNFPIQVNYWVRQTNSDFFRNIYDVQVAFSGSDFHNRLQSKMRERLIALAPSLKDSLLEKLYSLKQARLLNLNKELNTKYNRQKVIEAHEILKVPKITWDGGLPDSTNSQREDSLKHAAAFFLDQYAQAKKEYSELTGYVDSLKKEYDNNLQKINRYRKMISGYWSQMQSARDWKNKLHEYGMEHITIPGRYRWLLGVKNFSIGRSPVNYSELTAKNISVNGIGFEYNSWYYVAATAGTVNYRFRDFVVKGLNRKPQFLYMIRAGIGRLEKNYFIVSALRGQKQLFTGSSNGATIRVTGISAQSRWAINRTTYVTAEAGKSITPDYRTSFQTGNKFTWSDNHNQAIAFHLFSEWPHTRSKIEAFYKKTGANYQSFSSYTTNAAMESWYIKAEQNLFKRKLRIAASLRRNEFSNPFIVLDYKANTIFKSLSASLRIRKWPVVSMAWQPLSQLTKVDDQIIENRFQTFNATLFHMYSVKLLKASTTIMVNKFFNRSSDTAYLFYNATHGYLAQSFFFHSFTASVGASYTRNTNYVLQVLDGSIQPNIPRLGSIGAGIKINNLNHSIIKAGGYITANIRVRKNDMLSVCYEHGYLPGNYGRLVRNEMGTIQFVKTFNFR